MLVPVLVPGSLRKWFASRVIRAFLAAALAALASAGSSAEQSAGLDRMLERIFEKREFQVKPFDSARWLDNGRSYVTLEAAAAKAAPDGSDASKAVKDLVLWDTVSGRRQVLAAGSRLVPSGAREPLKIEDYALTSDRSRLLFFTNSKKVWRRNTRGDYWIFDVKSGTLRQLGAGAPASSLQFATLSPDGTRAAYVRQNNLYVEDLSSGAITPLTRDGSDTIVNGTSDWVNEEELGIREAFHWSPDGRHIAFWQFDTAGVELFTLIDDTDALYPSTKRFPYPKVGTKNSATRIGVVSAAGGPVRWIELPGDPREAYVPRMDWVDSRALEIQHLNRLQNTDELYLADAETGKAAAIHREESKTWVEVNGEARWIDHRRAFLWESEKDGWRHVYRISRDGSSEKLLTNFPGDVIRVDGVDETRGLLYFSASPENATRQFLYRARLDGGGRVERVTPADRTGTHFYQLSPDGRFAIHTWSKLDDPPKAELVELPAHRSLRALYDNAPVKAAAAELLSPPAELFRLPIGEGVVLDGWILKPRSFDPARKYPLVVYVYGEPAGQTVLDRWMGDRDLFHHALANEGYLVASFDNRGTPAPRGAAWRNIVYGSVGELSSREQAAAVRALCAERPYVDCGRVAIWGWSGGGSSTLNAMFRYPDVYRVGVAVAPVPDQHLYDTIYQERYMGLPDGNADGYRRGSPIEFAGGLKGRLLIVHGSGDDNVHYQGTERLVNRLVELGKPFDLMVYPNRTHAISEGKGTTLHLYSLIARYILANLAPAR